MNRWRTSTCTSHCEDRIARRRIPLTVVGDRAAFREPAADHHVGAGVDAGRAAARPRRVVLAVGVELHRALVAVAHRVREPGTQRAADPEVERQHRHVHAGRRATSAVRSVEPSDTTSTSYSGVCSASSFSTPGSDASSLYAGMITSVRGGIIGASLRRRDLVEEIATVAADEPQGLLRGVESLAQLRPGPSPAPRRSGRRVRGGVAAHRRRGAIAWPPTSATHDGGKNPEYPFGVRRWCAVVP